MTIYQKPINEITWADVEAFCSQGIPENAVLDYKSDFPANLENTASAMANTYGGIILIGVPDDKQNKPLLPVPGIANEPRLADRVTNICISNINPPLVPEIAVCENAGKTRAVIVVRIAESHETPHAISHNTRIYLRTGNRNNPEREATMDDIGWLNNRRAKAVELRDWLFENAGKRYWSLLGAELRRQGLTEKPRARLTLALSPLYPQAEFVRPPALNDIYKQIQVPDYAPTLGHTFPLPDRGRGRLLPDGIALADKQLPVCYTELNTHGLYYYTQLVTHEKVAEGHAVQIIAAEELFARVDQFVDSAIKFYDLLGYRGALHYSASLEVIGACAFRPYHESWLEKVRLDHSDEHITYESTMRADELGADRQRWVREPLERICWAYDYDLTQDLLDRYYGQKKKKR